MRQIVLDTETTGLEVTQGHRIIEIGCVELENRRLTGNHFHQYINPRREIDQGAIEVHGITNEFLADKPLFEHIAADFVEFIRGAELIIHNAPFDLGFLEAELQRQEPAGPSISELCTVVDTLVMARGKHPGQRNNLDALCQRYDVDNSQRDLHGALLDAEILADVYLAMTGGQTAFALSESAAGGAGDGPGSTGIRRLPAERAPLPIIRASDAERAAHEAQLEAIAASSNGRVLWRELVGPG
ncbi:MAG: DNA polymerase III subunit epsilon [Pseudomonadales bacterium]|nr:DNA polymerase III subunit epsilon [Pseudomonadales bacterium]